MDHVLRNRLRSKLVNLLEDACHRGRGRLDSGVDSDPEWFAQDMDELTEELDRILKKGNEDRE